MTDEMERKSVEADSCVCPAAGGSQDLSIRQRLFALRAALPDGVGHLVFWSIAIVGIVADLWTKAAVFSSLQVGEILPIIQGVLTFRPVLNDGAAFGIASGRQPLLVGVSLVATVAIIGIFLVGGMRRRIAQAALGLFVAGVVGNLWDRMFNEGCVRDFIDVVYWPGRHWNTFNLADAFLCAAVGLLAITSLFTPSTPSQTPAPTQKSEP
jgi:signal peptidase II